jgi:hypothetical protein
MSIRVRVTNRVLVPTDPLPPDWQEGEHYAIDRNGEQSVADSMANDDQYWEELERLASEIDPEDWNRMQSALDEHRREAKEWMRRRMGLS